jgi:Arc/MetJ-type ribon-helix-helix transcriptional regulator
VKQVLIELDDETAAHLDAVAPARSRKRSDFIRAAIRKALRDIREQEVEDAYRRQPDTEPAYFDAATWEVQEPRAPRRKRGSR